MRADLERLGLRRGLGDERRLARRLDEHGPMPSDRLPVPWRPLESIQRLVGLDRRPLQRGDVGLAAGLLVAGLLAVEMAGLRDWKPEPQPIVEAQAAADTPADVRTALREPGALPPGHEDHAPALSDARQAPVFPTAAGMHGFGQAGSGAPTPTVELPGGARAFAPPDHGMVKLPALPAPPDPAAAARWAPPQGGRR